MTEAAGKLVSRVLLWQLVISAVTASLLAPTAPYLLLLDETVGGPVTRTIILAFLGASAVTTLHAWLRLRGHYYLLRALALESRAIEPIDIERLGTEPGRLTLGWLVPHLLVMLVFVSPWRPAILDVTTGTSLALLGAVIVAAAALPLEVLVRAACLGALELAPPEPMREVVGAAERAGLTLGRIPRRMLIAVGTPVAFVAFGSALIANAHIRRADEHGREETARAVAQAALQPGPGFIEGAGLDAARERARELGFNATTSADAHDYALERDANGLVTLSVPLDSGSAALHYSGSTVPVLGLFSVVLASLLIAIAALLGLYVGRAYASDLSAATESIRKLGTQQVLEGHPLVVQRPRFRAVLMLELGIERVAARFRTFARAQQRAILSRETTTRTRGLFFASVSHDLKSPLNAILGFAELVRMDTISHGQAESITVIIERARELLAIIETILDAARVEAGHLSLMMGEMTVSDLMSLSIAKSRELGGGRQVEVVGEIGEGIGPLMLDRVRAVRALATLIGYSVRRTQQSDLRIVAQAAPPSHASITVPLASRRYTSRDIQRLLEPIKTPGEREHRGLALGLGLARTIFELHGGSFSVTDSTDGVIFRVLLPVGGPAAPPEAADPDGAQRVSRPSGFFA